MNPVAVKLRNLRTFEALDLPYPEGCAAIVGPNGVGKSTLVNAIPWALFGPDGRSWAPYLTAGGESTEMELELTFDHAAGRYRIRRGYSGRGAGKSTLDLERLVETRTENGHGLTGSEAVARSWEPAGRDGQRATQETIDELLGGLTAETLLTSAFVRQRDGGAFTTAKPADRKRILAKGIRLDRFNGYLEDVKADRKTAEGRVAFLNGALERADLDLEQKPALETRATAAAGMLADAEKARAAAERQLEEAARAAAEVEQARAARAEADAAVAAAEAALAPLEQQGRDADQADTELAIADDELQALTTPGQLDQLAKAVAELEGEIEGHRARVRAREEATRLRETRSRERDAIAAQAVAKREEASKLDAQIAHLAGGTLQACPACEREFGDDVAARDATLGNLRARADVLAGDAKALEEHAAGVELPEVPPMPEPPTAVENALQAMRERLDGARRDALQRERLAGRMQTLSTRADGRPADADLENGRRALQDARTAAAALPPTPDAEQLGRLQAEALTARAQVTTQALRANDAAAEKVRVETELERLEKIEAETLKLRREREALLVELDHLAVLERAYGPDGIPAWLIENLAVPTIELEANRILDELDTCYRVELRTDKTLASGATAPALDVIVHTDVGERIYEMFSGGEKTRLDLALRIAFSCLLAARGAGVEFLVIDEPEGLDEAGMAALVRVLDRLVAGGAFRRVFLISHHTELRSAFDQALELVKGDDGLSRIAA